MQTVLFHTRPLLLVVVHLLTVVGLEAGHADRLIVSWSGRDAFASHDCAGRELHVAIDHLHGCLACILQLQHPGVLRDPARIGGVPGYRLEIRLAAFRLPSPPSLHHSGLRGPPFA